ncbi:hypothetical protein BX600DRAFT_259936 [Xylariales sp. PMI_506]|nr:hypothetical protein BX600DRAFT_259936 [Xylariales sp. PMI_506]
MSMMKPSNSGYDSVDKPKNLRLASNLICSSYSLVFLCPISGVCPCYMCAKLLLKSSIDLQQKERCQPLMLMYPKNANRGSIQPYAAKSSSSSSSRLMISTPFLVAVLGFPLNAKSIIVAGALRFAVSALYSLL